MLTITSKVGVVKIARREEAGNSLPPISEGFNREPGKITRVSSTEEQPYVSANFRGEAFVGGQTLPQGMFLAIMAKAKKEGWLVEGEL